MAKVKALKDINTSFEFRTKFLKVVSEEEMDKVKSLFRRFCSLEPKVAMSLLWQLTYAPDAPITRAEFECQDVDIEFISSDSMGVYKGELAHQYRKKFPDFMPMSDIPDETRKAFDSLAGASDFVTAYMVCKRILKKTPNPESSRNYFLLSAEKESYYYGGIRNLGFSSAEAGYLKAYHEHIANMFKAIWDYQVATVQEEIQSAEATTSTMNKTEQPAISAVNETEELVAPAMSVHEQSDVFAPAEAEQSETQTSKVEEQANVTKKPENVSRFTLVTPSSVLENQELFTPFVKGDLSILFKISQKGFDLNEVMARHDKIRKFIEAAMSLMD